MEQNPQTTSQTGAPGEPVQVENVQYNVDVNDYRSKVALIFSITSTAFAVGGFMLASFLYSVTGSVFNFTDEPVVTAQLAISVLIPCIVIGAIALRRLNQLFTVSPEVLEDIKFKARLRKIFLFFLTISAIGSMIAIFNFINIFVEPDESTVQNQFVSLYYVGGAIIMTLWLYTLQKRTQR